MNTYPYFCYECKKQILDINDGFLIEKVGKELFCSEGCAHKFFTPLIEYFNDVERVVREEIKCFENIEIDDESLGNYIQGTLSNFDEQYVLSDELEKKYHYLIKSFTVHGQKTYVILICKFLLEKPSFLIHYIVTRSEAFLSYFKQGEFVAPVDSNLDMNIEAYPQALVDIIEQLRSELYAKLIELNSEEDIQMEEYHLYQKYEELTLSTPDEMFEYFDDEKRFLKVEIKAFSEQKSSFFYFVISYINLLEERVEKIPVLAFPSRDHDVYKNFAQGKRIIKKEFN